MSKSSPEISKNKTQTVPKPSPSRVPKNIHLYNIVPGKGLEGYFNRCSDTSCILVGKTRLHEIESQFANSHPEKEHLPGGGISISITSITFKKWLSFFFDDGKTLSRIEFRDENFLPTSEGINIGNSKKEVIKVYGKNFNITRHPDTENTRCLMYPSQGIGFGLDKKDRIDLIIVFPAKKPDKR